MTKLVSRVPAETRCYEVSEVAEDDDCDDDDTDDDDDDDDDVDIKISTLMIHLLNCVEIRSFLQVCAEWLTRLLFMVRGHPLSVRVSHSLETTGTEHSCHPNFQIPTLDMKMLTSWHLNFEE
jgi:hypothetical protein